MKAIIRVLCAAFALLSNVFIGEAQVRAQIVVQTEHYQAQLELTCDNPESCRGDFPRAGRNRRLNITRVSCWLKGDPGSEIEFGVIDLRKATTSLLRQYLPVDYSNATTGNHTLNRAVDVQFDGARYLQARFRMANNNAVIFASCTAIGTKSVLQ